MESVTRLADSISLLAFGVEMIIQHTSMSRSEFTVERVDEAVQLSIKTIFKLTPEQARSLLDQSEFNPDLIELIRLNGIAPNTPAEKALLLTLKFNAANTPEQLWSDNDLQN
jgi:hypothetical protein